jgi:RNA polymerase sigma-70 factor (ECF subfamily)
VSAREDQRRRQFSELYAALYGRVYAYAARRVGAESASDIAAETFLVAWRRFDAIPADHLPWLYGVARHVVLRHRSQRARQAAVARALHGERVLLGATEEQDVGLWEAWERLSDKDREVLALIAWEELSVRDAALSLGCSPAVFSVRLHRARRRLERLLDRPAEAAHRVSNLSEAS